MHHQTAEGGTETPGGQAGAAQETATEPDPEGEQCAEGKTHRQESFVSAATTVFLKTYAYPFLESNVALRSCPVGWRCGHSSSSGER